jgi:hypothetical protein
MTDIGNFKRAYAAFRSAVYPDYPRWTQLKDLSSELLTIDGHIAGYASRVYAGSLPAGDVPDLDGLVRDVKSLRLSLESLQPETEQQAKLLNGYRTYVSALDSLMTELSLLAREGPG